MLPGIFNNPYVTEKIMTRLTNKAPENVAPILPIEAAVTGGRSFWGWKRSGFLEFQERFLEEVAVAAVWLYGVKTMSGLIDKVISRMQKKGSLPAAYHHSDWSKSFMGLFSPGKNKAPSIHLTALERFSNSHEILMKTMKIKGIKLGISIMVPLLLCGIAIPKLNQWKTEWIIKKYYSPKDNPENKPAKPVDEQQLFNLLQEQLAMRAGTPASKAGAHSQPNQYLSQTLPSTAPGSYSRLYPASSPPQTWSSPAYYPPSYAPTFGMARSVPVEPQPSHTGTDNNGAPRFGFGGLTPSAGFAMLSKLGHYINNTAYGEILAIDAGITGGRMWSAWPRSPYEAFEYGARDAGSLLFYLLSVPWIMAGTSKFLNSDVGKKVTKSLLGHQVQTVLELDAQVINRLNEQLMRQFNGKPVTPEALKTLLEGTHNPAIMQAGSKLGTVLRQAPTQDFLSLMKNELLAFAATPDEAARSMQAFAKARGYLNATVKPGATFSVDQLETLLKGIWNQEGALQGLTDAQKFHLSTAAKNAFHHKAGISRSALLKTVSQSAERSLTKLETAPMKEATRLGGDKLISSSLRRSLNAANMVKALSDTGAKDAEVIVRAVERAVLEGTPIQSFVKDHLNEVIHEYNNYLKYLGKKQPYQPLHREITLVQQALKADKPLTKETLDKLADLLEHNGRSWPKGLKWLQGGSLGHLAEDVRMVSPLLDGKTPVSQVMTNQINRTTQLMLEVTAKHPHQMKLIQQYQGLIARMMTGEGRVSLMLSKSSPDFYKQLNAQMRGILIGGAKNTDKMYNKALQILHRMPHQAEHFFDASEKQGVQKLIDPYLDIISKRLKEHSLKNNGGSLSMQEFSSKILKPLARENKLWRYGTWGTAILISMWGVGMLIPKLQYYMTKALTGQDTHPGLAAVSDKLGAQQRPAHFY